MKRKIWGKMFGGKIEDINKEDITLEYDDEDNKVFSYKTGKSTIKIDIPSAIYIKNIIYKRQSVIGKGTFGIVYEYENQTSIKSFALKVGDIASDIQVIKQLEENHMVCNQTLIPYEIINKNMLIMEKFDGSLYDYTVKKKYAINIINQVAKTLKCLVGIGVYYTDLKLGNLLYKIKSDGTPFVVIGDLGGAEYDETGDGSTATFPPFDRRNEEKEGFFKNPTEKDIAWLLGICLLELLDININPYYYSNIRSMNIKEHNSYINKIIVKYPEHEDLIRGLLDSNPKERINLKTVIKMTEEGTTEEGTTEESGKQRKKTLKQGCNNSDECFTKCCKYNKCSSKKSCLEDLNKEIVKKTIEILQNKKSMQYITNNIIRKMLNEQMDKEINDEEFLIVKKTSKKWIIKELVKKTAKILQTETQDPITDDMVREILNEQMSKEINDKQYLILKKNINKLLADKGSSLIQI